jgi:hypothetical protein
MTELQPRFRALANPAQFERFVQGAGSRATRGELVQSSHYDWHGRKIFFEPYFRALVLHGCSDGKTLHDLHEGVTSDPLYGMVGAHLEVSVPALSKANATRPVEPFLGVLSGVLAAIDQLPSSAKILREVDGATLRCICHLLQDVKVFDATTFGLPDPIARWAKQGRHKAGFKLQLRLSGGYGGLDRILFTPAAGNDNPSFERLLDLQEGAGAIYLFDTGYFKIETYDRIVETGNHFVTPLHGNIAVEVVEDRPVPSEALSSGYVVHTDQIVRIGTGDRKSIHLYRLVDATDSRGQRRAILTDLVELPVDQICALRRYRWTVETVIRWLKKQLGLNHLISYSPRGVILQVTIALIVYGLLVLYNQQAPLSVARLRRKIRTDLHQALYEWSWKQGYQAALADHSGPAPPQLPQRTTGYPQVTEPEK